jgi:hypothetical protein
MSEPKPFRSPGDHASAAPAELVRGFTVALGASAGLLALGAISVYSMADSPSIDSSLRWVSILSGRINLALALGVAAVAYLRARESKYSLEATAACNIVLLFLFPFGSAVFLYWVFSVRKREHGWRAA